MNDRRARRPRDRARRAAVGGAGGRGGRTSQSADAARHAGLRAARHDHRARGRRARRHEPVDPGDARRVRDRLRHRPARRRGPHEPEPVHPVLRLRCGHPRSARAALRPLHARSRGGAGMRRLLELQELLGPTLVVVVAALIGAAVSTSNEAYFTDALVKVAIVVALYVFIGNSGVLSFGHISFVALGAWAAGVLSVPVSEKPAIMPNLAHVFRDRTTGNLTSLLIAALVGGVCALVVGLPLMRLSGLAAGIATFGVLEITHNLLRYEEKVGPGLNTFSSVPETTTLRQAAFGALVAVVVALVYARSRLGRLLRATREDPAGGRAGGARGDPAAARAVGASVYRQRLIAFTISGAVAGLAGGLLVHLLPVNTESMYLDLTFITLAMLVVGGATSR